VKQHFSKESITKMKACAVLAVILLSAASLAGADDHILEGYEKLGIIQGFPPPQEKQVTK
jgi:hypothetical protein